MLVKHDVVKILGVTFVVAVCAADYTIYTYIRPLFTNEMHFNNNEVNSTVCAAVSEPSEIPRLAKIEYFNNTWLNSLLFGMGIFFIIGNKFGGYLADNGGLYLEFEDAFLLISQLLFGLLL